MLLEWLDCRWPGRRRELFDLTVYDGPSATTLGERNSDLSPGTYYPNRVILDRGLAISGDGTRLLSSFLPDELFSGGHWHPDTALAALMEMGP